MVLYLGDKPIAGYSTNTKMNAHSLLDFKWSDHILNELSWVNADTFSWLSGDVYTAVYNKIVAEYGTGTTETETGVSYKKSDNGFKIADASQEQAVINAYNSTGVAWFYILDTANRRFKLPRTKYSFTGLRDGAGNYVPESLPNIRGIGGVATPNEIAGYSGAIYNEGTTVSVSSSGSNVNRYKWGFDASLSSSTYQDNAPVQERATQMYLYFYVGEFAQSAIEQTAGYAQTLTEKKADVDLSNVNASGTSLASGWSMPSGRYIDLTLGASGSTYTAPANGYVAIRQYFSAANGSNFIGIYTQNPAGIDIMQARPVASDVATFLPIKSGREFRVYYSTLATNSASYFRFIYAEGDQ